MKKTLFLLCVFLTNKTQADDVIVREADSLRTTPPCAV